MNRSLPKEAKKDKKIPPSFFVLSANRRGPVPMRNRRRAPMNPVVRPPASSFREQAAARLRGWVMAIQLQNCRFCSGDATRTR